MNKIIHHLGLDVHKETIAVAIAPAHATEVRRYGIIGGTLDAVDKLLKKLGAEAVELRVVYEAGPCGFVLCRHLRGQGIHCDVVAPSLIPKKASDRVKTDRRDAEQLARLYRAGELTAIRIPDQEDEAIRDLVRARFAAMTDQRQARNRLKGFLLRLGFRYTGKSSWNAAHSQLRWVRVKDAQFLVPQVKLAARFKGRLKAWLQTEQPELFKAVPAKVWWLKWVADVQPVGAGEAALKYLANYLCQPPLREHQIERDDAAGVTFRYRENDGTGQRATVSGTEFIRRVLQHVLPKGFQRVRHYGWRGAAARTKWARILALLDWRPPGLVPPAPAPPPKCPGCGKPMYLLGTLPRAPTGGYGS